MASHSSFVPANAVNESAKSEGGLLYDGARIGTDQLEQSPSFSGDVLSDLVAEFCPELEQHRDLSYEACSSDCSSCGSGGSTSNCSYE
jgi:hypothetical protein